MAAPKAAEPDADAADATSGGQSPPDLGALLRTGATLFGVPVRAVRIVTDDGREQRFELPAAGPNDEPSDLTPMQAAVSEVISGMRPGDVLSFEDIAEKAGYAASGKLRDFVRLISPSAKLKSTNRGWVKG